jgi:hypothetical protein
MTGAGVKGNQKEEKNKYIKNYKKKRKNNCLNNSMDNLIYSLCTCIQVSFQDLQDINFSLGECII